MVIPIPRIKLASAPNNKRSPTFPAANATISRAIECPTPVRDIDPIIRPTAAKIDVNSANTFPAS